MYLFCLITNGHIRRFSNFECLAQAAGWKTENRVTNCFKNIHDQSVKALRVICLSVWLLETKTKQYKGPRLRAGRTKPLIAKKGEKQFSDTESVILLWKFGDMPTHPLFFYFPAQSLLWKTLAPGRCHLKGWWKVQPGEAASGSSWEQSSARRTWCSGSPARSSKRRRTRLWWRRKSARSMRTSSPSFPLKRWVNNT